MVEFFIVVGGFILAVGLYILIYAAMWYGETCGRAEGYQNGYQAAVGKKDRRESDSSTAPHRRWLDKYVELASDETETGKDHLAVFIDRTGRVKK